jgi:hypothetical protein
MNDYARAGIELFGFLRQICEFFQYILLRLCNNNVLFIKQIDTDDVLSYAIPALGVVFYKGYLPRFCNEFEVLPLTLVYHVKNFELQRLICKNRCIKDVYFYITFLDEKVNFKNKDKISRKYMFVELGLENITSEFQKIVWCLLEDEYKVSELKKLIAKRNITSSDILIITDNDLEMEEFDDDQVIELKLN